jgi:hypothetical protein
VLVWAALPHRIDFMSTIVDFRHGRIAAACVCPIEACDDPGAPGNAAAWSSVEGAEIVLFPKISRKRLNRPRKKLTRRFNMQAQTLGDRRDQR